MVEDKNNEDEEVNIDFSKIKGLFKGKKKEGIKAQESSEKAVEYIKTEKKEDEDLNIDFSKIKNLFKSKKDNKTDTVETKESDEELNIDIKKTVSTVFGFIKKYQVLFLILIPILICIFFRSYPAYLPITDDWAQQSVYNNVKSSISSQIDQQYPNLPDANKNVLVDTKFQEVLKEQSSQIDAQIKATSDYFKTKMEDENGQKYLSDIDTYLWYGEVKNYLEYGHFGTEIVDGKEMNMLRNGREGKPGDPGSKVHIYFEIFLYKVMSIFNKDLNVMAACFYVSVIIIALSVIPAFFIGRRIGGNVAGFFAGMIVALNQALLERTPAGVADTDPWNVFFPLMIVWLFLESFEAKDVKRQIIYASLGGLFVGIFSNAWGGWWYPFDFILVMIVIYISYLLIELFMKIQENTKFIVKFVISSVTFFISSLIFVSLGQGFSAFLTVFKGPLGVIAIKDVGISSLWPNVMTTVAEFNVIPVSSISTQMGGDLFFLLGLAGITLFLVNKNNFDIKNKIYLIFSIVYYAIIILSENSLNNVITFVILISIPVIVGIAKIFYYKERVDLKEALILIIWFIGTAYGFTKGVRFAILMVPAFAIAFGITIGFVYNHLSKWLSKEMHLNQHLSKTIVVCIALSLFISPMITADTIAKQQIPLISDEWYDSLIGIKNNSTDAIITSWWDFGHWFVSIAERRVTFDGADQGERIHWVGKSLLTSDEDVAMGILRMLDCSQEKAPHALEKYLDNDTVRAIDVLNKIIVKDKKEASEILKKEGLEDNEIQDVLSLTHCDDLIPEYYITSEDMVGKAGVWAHFGSWDFKKAEMYTNVRKMSEFDGISFLTEKYNMTKEDASKTYYEIQTTDGDRWISPWPSYMGGPYSAQVKDNIVTCENGISVNLTDYSAVIPTQQGNMNPASIVYATKDDLAEKKFDKNTISASLALIPDGKGYSCLLLDPLLAKSMFTRLFFYDGHGSQHFKIFSDKTTFRGERIQVWKVNWEPGQANIIEELQEKIEVKSGNEITVDYIGWSEETGIFDSSIPDWRNKNITKDSDFDDLKSNSLTFTIGSGNVIPGFEKGVIGMKINSIKIIEIPPEEGYGTDPSAHPLGNKTLFFKVKVVAIS